MAATPPPRPVSRGMWVLIWLGGVDSFRLVYSSWRSQVSVRQNKSIWWSDIISLINTPLEERDLVFKSPHLTLLFWSITEVVLILIRFLWIAPLFEAELTGLGGRGTDTVSICNWVGNCFNGSAEKRVRLQLCLLVWTLGCHGFGLINSAILLDKRAAPSKVGCMPSLLIRP